MKRSVLGGPTTDTACPFQVTQGPSSFTSAMNLPLEQLGEQAFGEVTLSLKTV